MATKQTFLQKYTSPAFMALLGTAFAAIVAIGAYVKSDAAQENAVAANEKVETVAAAVGVSPTDVSSSVAE